MVDRPSIWLKRFDSERWVFGVGIGLLLLLTVSLWQFERSYEVERRDIISARESEKIGTMVAVAQSYSQRVTTAFDVNYSSRLCYRIAHSRAMQLQKLKFMQY